jgi:hypothetical protein
MRDDEQDLTPDTTPPPEDGFDTQDEVASDTPTDPNDGFEIEKVIETRPDSGTTISPEEGFETGFEIKSLDMREFRVTPSPPEEGFDEEPET